MENTDFPGNDISHGRSYQQSWQDCDEHCQHNPVCKYWTWGGSFYCFLKSSDKNKVDMNGLISGSKGCSAGAPSTIYIAPPTTTAPPTITCTPWYGRFHTGQDYYKIIENIATWEGCGTICKDDAKCKSWAWNVPDNSCFVTCKRCLLYKNSITLTDTSPNKDWISGPESCHTSLDCNYIGIGWGASNQMVMVYEDFIILWFHSNIFKAWGQYCSGFYMLSLFSFLGVSDFLFAKYMCSHM